MKHAPNIVRHLGRYRRLLALATLVLLAQAAVTVALPWPIKFLIDRVLLPVSHGVAVDWRGLAPHTILLGVVGVLLFLSALNALFDRLAETFCARAAHQVVESIRTELLELVLTRQQSFIDQRRKVDLLGRISGDAGNLEILIASGMSVLIGSLPTLLLILALLIFVDARLALILTGALPLIYGMTRIFSRRVRKYLKEHRSELNRFDQDTYQSFSASMLIKSLTLEPIILANLRARCARMMASALAAHSAQGSLTASLNGAKNLLRVVVVLLGGGALLRGHMTLGSLTLILAYIESINKPISEIAKFSGKLSKVSVSAERLEELYRDLDGRAEIEGTLDQRSLTGASGLSIRFDNVSFGYDRGRLLLDGFSGEFHSGELIAIVGPSGAGKSTLSKLMNRLIDPSEGQISLGGIDIRGLRLRTLRNLVTLVQQEPFFVRATISENLHLSSQVDHAMYALKAAAADDFVNALPERANTLIGEGGHPLSGGQAKRLHLARAFVRASGRDLEQSGDPTTTGHVFLFDEPTSGLDPQSARTVYDSLHRLAQTGAIVFCVTHCLDEVPFSSRVIYFPSIDGSDMNPLVGTHSELMDSSESYRRYFGAMSGKADSVGIDV